MTVKFHGAEIPLKGDFVQVGDLVKDFTLVRNDLSDWSLAKQSGKLILNIYPSIDTEVCAASTERFNKEALAYDDIHIECVSKDLPFAQQRFCAAKNIKKIGTLSGFRNYSFGTDYGIEIAEGPLTGLYARAIIILQAGKVLYTELVPEIVQEPDYKAALAAAISQYN